MENYSGGFFAQGGCEFNSCDNVFFSYAGILLWNFIERVSASKQVKDVGNSNSGTFNTRFAKSNIGVYGNSFFKIIGDFMMHLIPPELIKYNIGWAEKQWQISESNDKI